MPSAPISTRCTHYSPCDRLPNVDTRAGPTVGCITPQSGNPIINGARLIPTRCNNVLPTSPSLHTHLKPVGLALPPLPVLASYSQAQYACPVLDLGRAHKDTYGLLVETGPHYLTQAIHLSLVPSSTSHLTLLVMFIYMCVWLSLIVFQMPLKATTRFLMPPKAPT